MDLIGNVLNAEAKIYDDNMTSSFPHSIQDYYYHYYYYFHAMAVFLDEPWLCGSPSGPHLAPVVEENLQGLVKWVFYGPDAFPVTQPMQPSVSSTEGNVMH